MQNDYERITAAIPADLRTELEAKAQEEDRSMSALVRRALIGYLERHTEKEEQ